MTAVALQTGYLNTKAFLAAVTLSVVVYSQNKFGGQGGQQLDANGRMRQQPKVIQLGADLNQRNAGIGKTGPSQPRAQQRYDCGICLKRNVIVRQGKVLKISQCSHTFCANCLRQHVKQKIQEGFCKRIDCPQNGCIGGTVNGKRAQMNEGEIRKLVTTDQYMKDIKEDYYKNMEVCNHSQSRTQNTSQLHDDTLERSGVQVHSKENTTLNLDFETTYENCPDCSCEVKKIITSGTTFAGTNDNTHSQGNFHQFGSISANTHRRQQSLKTGSVKSIGSTQNDFGENILKCTSIKCKNNKQGCTEFCYLCGQNIGSNKYFHFFSIDKCQGRLKKKYN